MDAFLVIVPAFFLFAGGIAMLRLASKSESGTLKPNGIAGVRTTLTLQSEPAWYAAQSAAAPATAVAGWGGIAGGGLVTALGIAGLAGLVGDVILPVSGVLCIATAVWLVAFMLRATNAGIRAAAAADAAQTPG